MNMMSLLRESLSVGEKRKTHQVLNGSFIYLLFLVVGLLISDEELIMNVLCVQKLEIMTHFLLKMHECPKQ